MFKIRKSKDEEPTAPGQVRIKKKSKVPGVMITQFVEELPEGMSTPDFTRKPIALTIQEGKLAIFRAVITGNPTPTVTWARNDGEIDEERCQIVFDKTSGEHQLQMPDVSVDQADTYKCFARNEYGKAVVTAALNVIEVGYKKNRAMQASRTAVREMPEDFKKALKNKVDMDAKEEKKPEIDEKFWELLMSADKKDYESICAQYGVTDFRRMLTKLSEKKFEREQEQERVVERLCNLKPIELKGDDAEFELEMSLRDPTSKIFLFKDGVMIPFDADTEIKHGLKQVGKKFVFSINGVDPDDAGLYQVEVDGVKIFSTDFKLPPVEFLVKIQDVTAEEREDAVFECVVSHPLKKINWTGKNAPLEQGDKYDILVSEDMLIHTLVVKDCMPLDKGIYAAVTGMVSCSAWLIIEADSDPKTKGKKKARKTTRAGGGGADLLLIAQEQQAKIQKEREELIAKAKAEAEAAAAAAAAAAAEKAEAEAKAKAEAEAKAKAKAKTKGKTKATESETETAKTKTKTKAKAKPKAKAKAKVKSEAGEGTEAVKGADEEATAVDDVEDEEGEEEEEDEDVQEEEISEEGEAASSEPEQKGQAKEEEDSAEVEEGEPGQVKKKRVRAGPLVPDTVIDPGVYFTSGLSDVAAIIGTDAEMVCKLSSEDCDAVWYKEGKEITATDDICIVKDGTYRKLIIKNCKEEDSGKYRCEADGRKTEAALSVEDPPRINADDLTEFMKPVTIRSGKDAAFKVTFVGQEPMKIKWYNEGEELLEDSHTKIEISSSHSRLLLTKCPRKISGEIKIKIKNECGTTEAISQLVVLDKPTPPLGPEDIIESSSSCIEFKWRIPKDNGGSPITNYVLERQQIGRNSRKKLGKIGPEPKYRDTDVDHGRKYCYHIRAETDQGLSEKMETDDIQAGTKAYPGAPSTPKIVSAFKDCINLSWSAPTNTGGTNILGYIVEKRKNGSNLWGQVNPPDELIKEKKYAVKEVVEGMEYEFRVSAVNISGAGEPSTPSEFVFARDPKKPPGKVIDLKVTDSTYTTLSLGWTKPTEEEGVKDEAKGYFVELRPAENPEWGRCNSNAIIMTSYTIMGLKSMAMYWVRVVANNEGGDGEPQELNNYIIAMPPPVRPQFTDKKIKNFVVMKAGNAARINFNFVASPLPDIKWLKDGLPVAKHVTVGNTDTSSQLMIPSAERYDTGIYTIILKNLVGQETSSVEIRVTDDPKPPGPVELDENVSGTVTVSWTPSPDEKKDDRLHYMITKRDSVKRTWQTVADHLFNNKFTAINIMPGRQYKFRVYTKNDMGVSNPSESPVWEVRKRKETFSVDLPESKNCSFEAPPSFSVPLKMHKSPESYECYMSCAVTGNPRPHVTWYRNNISLNTNPNYYITNTCGVCSMVILKVGPKDNGDYTVIAESHLGRVECSTKLVVQD
ncbi:immunoglobulin-like and fibronectin type III domain-containing protein 1 [Centropristis striata]|uniref:immunoglobulin-like and fibronectin type III domain-containing protein 1 n=1 Tax=Centropristis striata TaxID=184440 RepID=UPI0027DF296F|nr:immunoglobulin-like and fibronectin type III domain-containing protein 1 [Centropristis striata]